MPPGLQVDPQPPAFARDRSLSPPEGNIAARLLVDRNADIEDRRTLAAAMTVAVVPVIPVCDLCNGLARYDMRDPTTGGWFNACPAHALSRGLSVLGSGSGAFLMTPSEVPPDLQTEPHPFADFDLPWQEVFRSLGFSETSSGGMGRVIGMTSVRVHDLDDCLRLDQTRRDPYFLLENAGSILLPIDVDENLVRHVILTIVDRHDADEPSLQFSLSQIEEITAQALSSPYRYRLFDELDELALLQDHVSEMIGVAISGSHEPSLARWAILEAAEKSTDESLLLQLTRSGGSDVQSRAITNPALSPAALIDVATHVHPHIAVGLLQRDDAPPEAVHTLTERVLLGPAEFYSSAALLSHPMTEEVHVPALIDRVWSSGGDARASVVEEAKALPEDRRRQIFIGMLQRCGWGKLTRQMMDVMLITDSGDIDLSELQWLEQLQERRVRQLTSKWKTSHDIAEPPQNTCEASSPEPEPEPDPKPMPDDAAGTGERAAPRVDRIQYSAPPELSPEAVAVRIRRLWIEVLGPWLAEVGHDLGDCWHEVRLERVGVNLDFHTPIDFGMGDPFAEGVGNHLTRILTEETGEAIRGVRWRHQEKQKKSLRRNSTATDIFIPGDPVDMRLTQAAEQISKRVDPRVADSTKSVLGVLSVTGVSQHRLWLAAPDEDSLFAVGKSPGAATALWEAVRRWQKAERPMYTLVADASLAARSPRLRVVSR